MKSSETFKQSKAFKYADPSKPTVDEITAKKNLGLPLFGWEKRILAMAGMRASLYEVQKCCVYCKAALTFEDATVDHLLPSSRGGADEKANLAICCYECNQLKGSMTVEEFLACDREVLKQQAFDRRQGVNDYRKSNKRNNHINFQICYMKGPHLC